MTAATRSCNLLAWLTGAHIPDGGRPRNTVLVGRFHRLHILDSSTAVQRRWCFAFDTCVRSPLCLHSCYAFENVTSVATTTWSRHRPDVAVCFYSLF